MTELSKVREDITCRGRKFPHTLYVLDEPAVGLHMADVEKLIHVLHRLVEAGHGLVAIEHHLLAEADWTLDFTTFILVRLVGAGQEGGRHAGPQGVHCTRRPSSSQP